LLTVFYDLEINSFIHIRKSQQKAVDCEGVVSFKQYLRIIQMNQNTELIL